MADDPKHLVEKGYDCIAQRYLEWSQPSGARMDHLQDLLSRLTEQAEVLELGCGAGVPCTEILARRCRVTATDISATQIELAKRHVPGATLIKGDMMLLDFPPETFDAVVAFYSIIHLPRLEQPVLLKRISDWLRPGGYFLANMGTVDDSGSVEPDWLGSVMFWSSYDAQTNGELVRDAGLDTVTAKVLYDNEDGRAVPFLWILARKTYEHKQQAVIFESK